MEINTNCQKGILFVYLFGQLTKNTVIKLNEEVTTLVKDNGIKNIVFNITDLNLIDINGINALYSNYKLIKENNGYSCLCGINNPIVKHRIANSKISKYIYEASDEIGALNLINLFKEQKND